MDPRERTLCKNGFLFDQLIIFFLNQIELPLNLIDKLARILTVIQAVLVAPLHQGTWF